MPRRSARGVPGKAHLIYHGGRWKLFRSPWKSQFVGPKLYASCITAPTIPALIDKLRRSVR